MLPALPFIANDLNITGDNTAQYIIGVLFLGFTFGQIFYGPLSDSFGRKPSIYIGITIFIFGSILSISAQNYTIMLMGRLLQGLGVAAPRVISTAMIRDKYKGRDMARVMSLIMSLFIIVPAIAPTLGQAILYISNWRMIFAVLLCVGLVLMIWVYFRLPETLPKAQRIPFNFKEIGRNIFEIIKHKSTMGYTICTGLIFAILIGYLNSAQQIFQVYYDAAEHFPIYFGIIALSLGVASLLNSYIVRYLGMHKICHYSLIALILISATFATLVLFSAQQVPFWQFMVYAITTFFFLGLLFGNLNAIAMEPMGHIAGVASATIGVLSSGLSLIIGTIIGQLYNDSLLPVIFSFLLLSSIAFCLQLFLDKE